MSTFSLLSRLRLAALPVLAALLLSGPATALAQETPAGTFAFSIEIPAGKLTLKEVHDIVLRAAIGRSWDIKEDSDARVVTYLNHRKNEATVTYLISETSVQAYCEGYATNGKGVRRGPEQPTGWLNFLKKDISKAVNEAVYLGKK